VSTVSTREYLAHRVTLATWPAMALVVNVRTALPSETEYFAPASRLLTVATCLIAPHESTQSTPRESSLYPKRRGPSLGSSRITSSLSAPHRESHSRRAERRAATGHALGQPL
jgi:hypothetical protein